MASVVYAQAKDLPEIASVHKGAFPKALSTKLGEAYIISMLSWFLSTEKTFLFYVKDDSGRPIGYCSGIIRDGVLKTGSSSGIAQHSFNKAVVAFLTRPWLLFHPEIRLKYKFILKNIKNKLFKNNLPDKKSDQSTVLARTQAGLVSIGVLPEYFGKGIGSMMIKEFEIEAGRRGIGEVYLSVHQNNQQAIKSYERNGWAKTSSFGDSVIMEKHIDRITR